MIDLLAVSDFDAFVSKTFGTLFFTIIVFGVGYVAGHLQLVKKIPVIGKWFGN